MLTALSDHDRTAWKQESRERRQRKQTQQSRRGRFLTSKLFLAEEMGGTSRHDSSTAPRRRKSAAQPALLEKAADLVDQNGVTHTVRALLRRSGRKHRRWQAMFLGNGGPDIRLLTVLLMLGPSPDGTNLNHELKK